MPLSVYLWALVIFAARLVDVTLGTIRVQLIVRRRKALAAAIGFVEVLIFILVVSRVIQGVRNWPYVIGYAGGFAVGTLVGISLSERLSRGVVEVTIIPHGLWQPVEEAVRQAGFALTRHAGAGRDGRVEVFSVVCSAREVARLMQVVSEADPKAFLYAQELARLRGGYIYGMKSKL